MLKIKDNVDLKELEKFGFYDNKYCYSDNPYHFRKILIYKKDRYINFYSEWYGSDFNLIDTIFDLIQAGLVEKVN